jgi:hypothetical protein
MHADGFAAKFSWRSSPLAGRHFVIPVAVVVIKSERLDALPGAGQKSEQSQGFGLPVAGGDGAAVGDENFSQVCNLQPARKIADWK